MMMDPFTGCQTIGRPADSLPFDSVPSRDRRRARLSPSSRRRSAAAAYPLRPLSRTPSTMRRFATRNTSKSGTALSAAPAMIGPYDSEL